MITPIKPYSLNFGAAQVNILATSDNHGNVLTLPLLAQTVENNKDDIFVKAKEKSTLNLFAIAGDWFINPSKKGFLTKPDMSNGDIQLKFLDKFIAYINKQAGMESNFDTVFTMGNHDLDGGDKFMYKVINHSDMKTLVTNVDLPNSPGIKDLMDKYDDKIVKSVVYEVQDDKNPDLKHKVLVLGVTIPSMKFYNPNLLKHMAFMDDCNKKDANLKESDLQKTFNAVKIEVDKFKEENPKGAVVLMSHTGAPISKMIRDYVPEINVILNGHDHKNLTSLKTQSITNIDSLGADNNMIKAFKLKFDDDGELETDINTFYSRTTVKDNLHNNPLQKYIHRILADDLRPIVSFIDTKTGGAVSLDYGDSIRYKNSYLANYLTSAVKRSVRELCDDKSVIVGIQSSIIRGGLKDGSNNLDIMKVFDGVSEDLSNVQVGSVMGKELVGLIVENIKSNLKAPKRNTIIQWSDIQVNRTLISKIVSGESTASYDSAIKVRNEKTNKFIPIDLNKRYTIAIGEKFLVKDDIEWPKRIRDRFVSLHKTYDQLFREYISSPDVNYHMKATAKTKEKRIL